MHKNLTLRQITWMITAIIAAISLLVFIALIWSGFLIISFYFIPLIFILQVLVSYLIVKTLLERYVFRKIKLIYKFIYDSKLGPAAGKQTINFNETSIEDVNLEVIEWGKRKEKEIETLRTLENYRKNYVGNISHELKTPIFSIQGYLHTLLDGGLYDHNINVKYLERAAVNVDRLQNIVEDLEVISKLESGQAFLDIKPFDIKVLADEVISDLQVIAAEKSTTIRYKEDANQNFQVLGDREAIRQVLINLLVNSIKYTNDKGITRISFYDVDQNILVEISDNGIGIEEKHLKHVFDRFYRIDASRSRSEGGSGLGLSIVKHIIEAHKQTIHVRSTPGIGSTFGFTLKKV